MMLRRIAFGKDQFWLSYIWDGGYASFDYWFFKQNINLPMTCWMNFSLQKSTIQTWIAEIFFRWNWTIPRFWRVKEINWKVIYFKGLGFNLQYSLSCLTLTPGLCHIGVIFKGAYIFIQFSDWIAKWLTVIWNRFGIDINAGAFQSSNRIIDVASNIFKCHLFFLFSMNSLSKQLIKYQFFQFFQFYSLIF